ncbi:MAG: hypothetical protein J0H06_02475 [Actinobacteria bacterium]|nr:hypothetical protein [Actinomycetota bacterium]OJU84377.1 MAG: hypothetical protein BGO11_16725 [Solirubrobacterales bacterium 70-9]
MAAESQTADPRRLEGIVLKLLLDAHPTPVAEADLVRSLDDGTDDVEIGGAVEVAVRGLRDSGLANVADGLIFPTIAAVQLDQLLAD